MSTKSFKPMPSRRTRVLGRWESPVCPNGPVRSEPPLPERLDAQLRLQTLDINMQVADESRAVIEERLGDLRRARVNELAVRVSDHAPRFKLDDGIETLSLGDLLERGPVVLSFFLGSWSPYCTLTMRAMQAWLPQFERFGAQVVAIAPDPIPDPILDYRVIIDPENKIARQFGVVVRLAGEIVNVYRQLGFDVPPAKGRDDRLVPLPATFVIDRQRVIRYAFVNPDFRRRAEPAEIAAALASI